MAGEKVGVVNAWEQDPGSGTNPDGGALLQRPVPNLEAAPFPTSITGAKPPVDHYSPGTVAFRYWSCADALRRASDFWGKVLGNQKWNPAIKGPALPVILDEGVDLNAYYDRSALNFFHAAVGGRMVYSGESPDVVCHEFGHAVLDAIRPQLWDVSALEPPAFHESLGDMSAILTALQLPSVRAGVLQETHGRSVPLVAAVAPGRAARVGDPPDRARRHRHRLPAQRRQLVLLREPRRAADVGARERAVLGAALAVAGVHVGVLRVAGADVRLEYKPDRGDAAAGEPGPGSDPGGRHPSVAGRSRVFFSDRQSHDDAGAREVAGLRRRGEDRHGQARHPVGAGRGRDRQLAQRRPGRRGGGARPPSPRRRCR